MQNGHKRVEHFTRNILVDSLILLVVHSFTTLHASSVGSHDVVGKNIVNEALNILLVILPVFIAQVLTFLVSIHSFSKFLPLALLG